MNLGSLSKIPLMRTGYFPAVQLFRSLTGLFFRIQPTTLETPSG